MYVCMLQDFAESLHKIQFVKPSWTFNMEVTDTDSKCILDLSLCLNK